MDGILIVDKPGGLSSHDVVARARRITRIRQIGHAGTLDPMATGVLVLCIGQATRLSEYLLGEDKHYEGVITFGQRTNTDDTEGEVISERPVALTQADLDAVAPQFTGPIQQVPPQFSAIQRDGKRAYALARKGETVELDARPVKVHRLALSLQPDGKTARIEVSCVAGTYIRSLARDIGEALGCGGHLSMLRRTKAGIFGLADSLPMDQLEAWQTRLLPMDRAVEHFPEVRLTGEEAKRVQNGQFLPMSSQQFEPGRLLRLYAPSGALLAIGQADADGDKFIRPAKVFSGAAT